MQTFISKNRLCQILMIENTSKGLAFLRGEILKQIPHALFDGA